jgi:hypothetical protein
VYFFFYFFVGRRQGDMGITIHISSEQILTGDRTARLIPIELAGGRSRSQIETWRAERSRPRRRVARPPVAQRAALQDWGQRRRGRRRTRMSWRGRWQGQRRQRGWQQQDMSRSRPGGQGHRTSNHMHLIDEEKGKVQWGVRQD